MSAPGDLLGLLRELLHYDPNTGVFRWLRSPTFSVRAGSVAGATNYAGYIRICIGRRHMFAHRLAWAMSYGDFPAPGMQIDHINHNRADNRLSNLRVVTPAQNRHNVRGARRDSGTGLIGVIASKGGRFRACIKRGGVRRYLGTFASKEAAHRAYMSAALIGIEGAPAVPEPAKAA